MKRSYDTIAGVYDWLASAFIGKALQDAQMYSIQHIPAGSNILIAGGGTGWILEAITKVHYNGLQIDYVDSSAGMIAKAKKRHVHQNVVRFFNQSAEKNFEGKDYDVILTPFFFDNFKNTTVESIFTKLHPKLKRGGLWLYVDFQVAGKQKFYQKALLLIMYTFFRAVCNIEANQLPDIASQFVKYGYELITSTTFKQEFIVSAVYKKVLHA